MADVPELAAPKSNFHLSIRGTCKDPTAVEVALLEFAKRLKTEFGCDFADGRMRMLTEHAIAGQTDPAAPKKTDAERRAERRGGFRRG